MPGWNRRKRASRVLDLGESAKMKSPVTDLGNGQTAIECGFQFTQIDGKPMLIVEGLKAVRMEGDVVKLTGEHSGTAVVMEGRELQLLVDRARIIAESLGITII